MDDVVKEPKLVQMIKDHVVPGRFYRVNLPNVYRHSPNVVERNVLLGLPIVGPIFVISVEVSAVDDTTCRLAVTFLYGEEQFYYPLFVVGEAHLRDFFPPCEDVDGSDQSG